MVGGEDKGPRSWRKATSPYPGFQVIALPRVMQQDQSLLQSRLTIADDMAATNT